jgi:dynein heavy chain
MMAEGLIDQKEYSFFLRGGTVLQREGQPVRPPGAGWITDQAWDNVCELEK